MIHLKIKMIMIVILLSSSVLTQNISLTVQEFSVELCSHRTTIIIKYSSSSSLMQHSVPLPLQECPVYIIFPFHISFQFRFNAHNNKNNHNIDHHIFITIIIINATFSSPSATRASSLHRLPLPLQ
jgi:hypothetical protein